MPKKRQPSVWNTHKKHYILQVLGAFSKTLILLGFVWIDEKGKSAPTNEACAINCALKGAEFSTFYVVWLHQKGRKSALTNDNCPTSCPLTEGGDFSIIFFPRICLIKYQFMQYISWTGKKYIISWWKPLFYWYMYVLITGVTRRETHHSLLSKCFMVVTTLP